MKKLYIIVFALFFSAGVFAQNAVMNWANLVSGEGTQFIRSMSTDANGNIYIGGTFTGTVDFDPGSGDASHTSQNSSSIDGFVAKFDPDGNFQWVSVLGGVDDDAVYGIASDVNGVYVTGYFSGTAYFDENFTTFYQSNDGSTDIFLAKYNSSNGNLVFATAIGGQGGDYAYSVALDASSNVYVGGEFSATVDFGSSTKTVRGLSDAFIAKFTGSGVNTWVTNIGSDAGYEYVSSIAFGANNSVWVGGAFSDFLYTDPNDGTTGIGCTGGYDGFVAQYGTDGGNHMWHGYLRSLGNDYITSIKADDYGVYAGGYYEQTAEVFGQSGNQSVTSSGYFDGLLFRLDPSSYDLKWVDSFGSSGDNDYVDAIELVTGNIYVAGGFAATMDVDPSAGQISLDNNTFSLDAFLLKYNWDTGALVDAQSIGNGGSEEALCLLNSNGSLYWAGVFDNISTAVDIDPGIDEQFEISEGSYDAFFARLDAVEPPEAPTQFNPVYVDDNYVEFSFTAPIQAPDGYLVIYKIGADPTGVPVDGTYYYYNDRIGNGKAAFNTPGSYNYFQALPGITYHLAIYAYNGSGDGIDYTTTPLLGTITTTGTNTDLAAPTIVDNSPTKAAPGSSIKLKAKVTDNNTGVSSVYVSYSSVNSRTVNHDVMTQTGADPDVYEFDVPASFFTEAGVEYALSADDAVGNTTENPVFKTVLVEHTGTGLTIPYSAGSQQANYRIISIPLNLANKTVADVFGDDLGDYNKSKYRLFHYTSANTSELSSSSNLEIGQGYWFIAAESKTVSTGPGTTAAVGDGKPFYVNISNGWNQIGNPYNFDLPWALINLHPDNDDITLGDFKTYEGSFQTGTVLKKMSGGFVMVQASGDGKLRIPVYDANARISAPAVVDFQQTIASGTWAVDLILRSGGIENKFGGFGMHPDASEQNDMYDDFTLPRFMDYLELNYDKKLFGSAFTKDIVPTSPQHVWQFEVESNLADEMIQLNWNNDYFGSTDLQLVLWDVEQQRAVDMKQENSYIFERSQSHSFKVFYGDEAFVKRETLPYRAVFHSASPVPSSGNVTLSFSVPEAGAGQKTNLAIYNLMGQKVANLVDKTLPAGYQQAIWNIESGEKPATGMYISVLKFGDTTLQKRLIIK